MKTILIVDDSPTMLMSLEGVLSRGGYQVAKAGHGEDAMAQVNGGLVADLVITDYNMPGMNGIDLIRSLRKVPAFRFKPILMLTTESEQAKRNESKAAGATGWLVKPIAPEDLLKVVKQVMPGT